MAHPDSVVAGPPGLVLRSFGGGADGSPRTFSEATLLHERLAAELFDVGGRNAVCDEEIEAALCCAGEGFATRSAPGTPLAQCRPRLRAAGGRLHSSLRPG